VKRKPAFISINAQTIRRNAVLGMNDAPIRIARSRSDKAPRYASEVVIRGPSRLIYDPGRRILACGARLALEVQDAADVEVVR
jgi:hypothetical protein